MQIVLPTLRIRKKEEKKEHFPPPHKISTSCFLFYFVEFLLFLLIHIVWKEMRLLTTCFDAASYWSDEELLDSYWLPLWINEG